MCKGFYDELNFCYSLHTVSIISQTYYLIKTHMMNWQNKLKASIRKWKTEKKKKRHCQGVSSYKQYATPRYNSVMHGHKSKANDWRELQR